MSGELERRLAAAGIDVPAESLADPDTRRCLGFLMGQEETLDALASCYRGESREYASVYERGREEDLGLLAQRLGLGVQNGVLSQEEAREILRKRGLEFGATPLPPPEKGGSGDAQEAGDACPIDAAVADGRITTASAGSWRKLYARRPAEVEAILASLPPDLARASKNYWSDPARERQYREYVAHVGLTEEEVL